MVTLVDSERFRCSCCAQCDCPDILGAMTPRVLSVGGSAGASIYGASYDCSNITPSSRRALALSSIRPALY